MIEGFLLFGGCLALWRLVRRMESKPSRCPRCGARSLIPDQDGYLWRCMPCEAQYRWVQGLLQPIDPGRPRGDEAVPTAKLRGKPGSDKVEP